MGCSVEKIPLEPDQIIWNNLTGSHTGICKQLCQLQMEVIIFVSIGMLIAGIHIVLHWTLVDFNRQFDSDHHCPTQVDDEFEFKKSLYYGHIASAES